MLYCDHCCWVNGLVIAGFLVCVNECYVVIIAAGLMDLGSLGYLYV